MVHTSRRQLLAVGGLAAIAGCLSSDDDEPSQPVPEAADDAPFSAVPAAVDGFVPIQAEYTTAHDRMPTVLSRIWTFTNVLYEIDLDPAVVDSVAFAMYVESGEAERPTVGGAWVFTGSFAADDLTFDEEIEEISAVQKADGLLILSFRDDEDGGEQPWPALLDAVEATRAGDRESLRSIEATTAVHDEIDNADARLIMFPEHDEHAITATTDAAADALSAYGIGLDVDDDRTVEGTHVVQFEDESVVDPAVLETHAQERYQSQVDIDIETDDRFVFGEFTHQFRPAPDREASPDARLQVRYDPASGTARVRHDRGEPVPAETLHAFVDDEPVDLDWNTEQIEEGDTTEISVDPLDVVEIEWRDPDDEETFDNFAAELIAPEDAFTPHYDPDRDEVIVSYDGPTIERTDRLELRIDSESRTQIEQPVAERTDRLEAGDELLVEEIGFGERLRVSAVVTGDRGQIDESLLFYRHRVPGSFRYNHDESQVVYWGETEREADNYRITIDDEPADSQFADSHATLQQNDAVEIDANAGEYLVVEWIDGDEQYEAYSDVVSPVVDFAFYRDTDQFVLEYTSGEPWPAEEFSVIHSHDASVTQFSDEHETIAPGDAVGIEYSFGDELRIEYTGGREPVTVFVGYGHRLGEFTFEFDEDGSTLTYEGQGEWPADTLDVRVDGESHERQFADAHETVTTGDEFSVDLDLGAELSVVTGDEEYELVSAVGAPEMKFEPTYTEETIELTYEGEQAVPAELLEIEVIGPRSDHEATDPWGDSGDIEPGDTVAIDVSGEGGIVSIQFGGHEVHGVPIRPPS